MLEYSIDALMIPFSGNIILIGAVMVAGVHVLFEFCTVATHVLYSNTFPV